MCGIEPGNSEPTEKMVKSGLCSDCRSRKRYHNNKHRCPDCGTMHRKSEGVES